MRETHDQGKKTDKKVLLINVATDSQPQWLRAIDQKEGRKACLEDACDH